MSFEMHLLPEWNGKIPPLFRYMKREHVNEFFGTGALMLTTYARCAAMDATRQDRREGKMNSLLRYGDRAIAGLHGVGKTSYMLCTSLVESKDLMHSFEGTDDYFRIDDTAGFVQAVANSLPGYQKGLMGPCIYLPERSIECDDPAFEPDASELLRAMQGGDEKAMQLAVERFTGALGARMNNVVGVQPYFVKVAGTHEDEREFRLVWLVDRETGAEPITLNVPRAVQYCSRTR
jgi:hypothetical protein